MFLKTKLNATNSKKKVTNTKIYVLANTKHILPEHLKNSMLHNTIIYYNLPN